MDTEYNGWTNVHTWKYGLEMELFDYEDSYLVDVFTDAMDEGVHDDMWAYRVVTAVSGYFRSFAEEMFSEAIKKMDETIENRYVRSEAQDALYQAERQINWWELATHWIADREEWLDHSTKEDREWLTENFKREKYKLSQVQS